jgi:hypothetical protein
MPVMWQACLRCLWICCNGNPAQSYTSSFGKNWLADCAKITLRWMYKIRTWIMKTEILNAVEFNDLKCVKERLEKIFKASRKKTVKPSGFSVPEPNLTQDERDIENEIRLLDKIISRV